MKRWIFLFFLLPALARGQIIITEIMYDPKDTDANSGGEWIEVKNTGGSSVDLTKWYFFEADTNHGITADGATEIPAGGYAIISRDLTVFKNYFASFGGLLFKASFSLNDGESLGIKNDKNGAVLDSVTYTSEWGAKNDGNSLQKNSSGNWIAVLPTPGEADTGVTQEGSSSQTTPSETSFLPASGEVGGASPIPTEPQIFADAGKDKVVISGATATFEGRAYGLKNEPLENARFLWNFGDGATAEGKSVLHTYRYPGDYTAVLDVSSGYFSGADYLKVKVEILPVSISSITDGKSYFIELNNSSKLDIDLSGFILAASEKTFEIPKNTFISGSKRLIFSNEITGLPVKAGSMPELRYQNGVLAYRYENNKNVHTEPQVSAQTDSPVVVRDKKSLSEIFTEPEIAAAGSISSSSTNYIWPIGVALLTVISIGGLFFARRLEEPKDETEKLADGFEIVEDK